MKKIIVLLIMALISCRSEYHQPDYYYKSKFDVNLVDQVDQYFKNLAKEKNLRVFEKSRREMKAITQGQDAFFIAYYIGKQKLPLLTVSNAGGGSILTLDLLSNEEYSIEKVELLAKRVLSDLKTKFNIEMVEANSDGSFSQ